MNKNLDNEYKNVVYNSYHHIIPKITDWTRVLNRKENLGFEGDIYYKGNDVVVVYNGTNSPMDIVSDVDMVLNRRPFQTNAAIDLYNQAKILFPDANITVTGHSLGGSLAQIVSAHTGVPAVTFNAYGTADILAKEGFNNPYVLNIKNYGNPEDPIFGVSCTKQPGRTFFTNTDLNPDNINKIGHGGSDILSVDLFKHYIENMSDLSDAVEVFPDNNVNFKFSDIKNTPKNDVNIEDYNYTLQGRISNENIWQKMINHFKPAPTGFSAQLEYDANHIFTPEEIGNLSPEKFNQYEDQIMTQLQEGKINNQSNSDFSSYKNPFSGNAKIYSREDLDAMSTNEYSQNEKEIFAQMNSIGVPTNSELHGAAGTIYVESYTRRDGTVVKGYYRSV